MVPRPRRPADTRDSAASRWGGQPWRDMAWLPSARFGHIQDRARLGIALTESDLLRRFRLGWEGVSRLTRAADHAGVVRRGTGGLRRPATHALPETTASVHGSVDVCELRVCDHRRTEE